MLITCSTKEEVFALIMVFSFSLSTEFGTRQAHGRRKKKGIRHLLDFDVLALVAIQNEFSVFSNVSFFLETRLAFKNIHLFIAI